MEVKPLRNFKHGPEAIIQNELCLFLRARSWFVMETHGNMFQSGFPDLFITHLKYRSRWVECKCPTGSRLEQSQLETFPHLCANGSGVWILTGSTMAEYDKLFQPCNWWHFLMNQKGQNPFRHGGPKCRD